MNVPMRIRLLIVDDHDVIRDGLRLLFQPSEIEVVAEANGGHAALKQLGLHELDVALVDMSMPEGDGLDFLQHSGRMAPNLRVLMHSAQFVPTEIARSRALGAYGYLVKGADARQLVTAVRKVFSGHDLWEDSQDRRWWSAATG